MDSSNGNGNQDQREQRQCRDCRQAFYLDRSHVEWFESRNLRVPVRCEACRAYRRQEREETARAAEGNG